MKAIKKSVSFVLALALLLPAAAFTAFAADVNVSTFEQLRAAVSNAVGPTKIIICDNIVFPANISISSGKDITIASSEGNHFTLTAESARHFTILSAALSVENVTLDGAHTGGGITAQGDLTLTLTGVVLQRCGTDYLGGGIFNIGGTITLDGCVLRDNAAGSLGGGGGGIYTNNGIVTLNNSELSGNTAPSSGGAICNVEGGNVIVNSCEFSGNAASTGGAIYNSGAADISDCKIIGNTALAGGGGIYNNGGSALVRGCEFIGNTAAHYGGGGIYTTGLTDVTVSESVFSGNTASQACWMTDAADIATHNAQITGVTQFSAPPAGHKPFAYAYNNYDISYTTGLLENPDIVTYTVRFLDWDGAVLDRQTVERGKAAAAPVDPTRTGYTFTGWDVDFSNIIDDLTVTARYAPNLLNIVPTASVKKLNGNQNELTVIVTETYYDGSVKVFTKNFMINNNAAGTYEVGPYKVYVDTKGNTQIRLCYIMG